MKINLVCVEDALIAIGFRKIAAVVKKANPDTQTFYIPLSLRSLINRITSKQQAAATEEWVGEIAQVIAQADLIGFSSMSDYAELVARIAARVKAINPSVYIVWGGCHPIIVPEDAIQAHVDAICTGEGELVFPELIQRLQTGQSEKDLPNFWFRQAGEILKNPFRPLSTCEEMDQLPFLDYAEAGEKIFEPGKGIREITQDHYLAYSGLGYNTVWTIGCPFRCTYCGNTKFIDNDANYRRIRHPSVDYIIEEIQRAVNKHPHISSVIFHDDSFMALPTRVLAEFAERYRQEIHIPFAVFGVIPNYVSDEKFKILIPAGMNRIRMGIQSGSERILEFYRRPTPPKKCEKATTIIGHYVPYMIPPAYDIIVDNPIETQEDVQDTLRMIYHLPRPFTLNPFSLRIMPNTDMAKQFEELRMDYTELDMAKKGYLTLAPTLANALLYLLCVVKPPQSFFAWWLRKCQPSHVPQKQYPMLNLVLRTAWLVRRGLDHSWHMDFALIPGKFGYILWKTGVLTFWRKWVLRKYRS